VRVIFAALTAIAAGPALANPPGATQAHAVVELRIEPERHVSSNGTSVPRHVPDGALVAMASDTTRTADAVRSRDPKVRESLVVPTAGASFDPKAVGSRTEPAAAPTVGTSRVAEPFAQSEANRGELRASHPRIALPVAPRAIAESHTVTANAVDRALRAALVHVVEPQVPAFWATLEHKVDGAMPHVQRAGVSMVVSPVIVSGTFDSVPGIGVGGEF
jgi:hypothetical protein